VGQQGTGKTYLLAQILKEFHVKVPNVGILILNLGKGNQEHFYSCDEVIKFGDKTLRVPYYYPGKYPDKTIQETAEYLIASLGLKNIVEKNMLNVMQAFISKKGGLPKSLNMLFQNLVKYFNDFPYHDKFQTNILRAIKNRVLSLLSNPDIENTMRLSENREEIPQWFNDWRSGKKIYLDLSMCSLYEKRLLTSAIFQLVRAITPDFEASTLKNIIVIDEAHQILEKPISKNYEDDDFIAREQLEKIFNQLLREFRSKGLSFIIADQTPSRLFESVTTLPSLKIIFRVGFPCNNTLLGNPVEQDFLMCQKNRQALVLNGITGEKFIMETIEVKPEKIHVKDQVNIEELPDRYPCPFCMEIIQNTDLLCPYCAESVLPNPLDD